MRLSEHRHARDLRRYTLALRMLRHGARTRTIVTWSGLSGDRITKLASDLGGGPTPTAPTRLRGHSPYQTAFFFRSAYLTCQATAFAFYCQQLEVLTQDRGPAAVRHLPGLTRGEHLCEAYEFYRLGVVRPLISFEHAVLLLTELTRGEELALKICDHCSALFLSDTRGHPHCDCTHCRPTSHLPAIPGDHTPTAPPRDRPLQLPLSLEPAAAAQGSPSAADGGSKEAGGAAD